MDQKKRSKRTEQNQINALRSTGPRTDHGKKRSRENSLKHGFTATVLILPDENPDVIDAHIKDWVNNLSPANESELKLAEKLAVESLRLERLHKAETATVSEQVANVETDWDHGEQSRLIAAQELFWKDAARGVLELQSFAAGVAWLIDRWEWIRNDVRLLGVFTSLDQIKQSLRLLSYNPENLRQESRLAFDWAIQVYSLVPKEKHDEEMFKYLNGQSSIPSKGDFIEVYPYPLAETKAKVLARIEKELTDLDLLGANLELRETDSIENAKQQALCPFDTPQNRLMLRYLIAADSGFCRTLKTLEKLKLERKKEEKKGSKPSPKLEYKPVSRNEATEVSPRLKDLFPPELYDQIGPAKAEAIGKSINELRMGMAEAILDAPARGVEIMNFRAVPTV